MVRDAPQAALLTMRVQDFAAKQDLILRSPAKAGVSKDGLRRDCQPRATAYAIALPQAGRGEVGSAGQLIDQISSRFGGGCRKRGNSPSRRNSATSEVDGFFALSSSNHSAISWLCGSCRARNDGKTHPRVPAARKRARVLHRHCPSEKRGRRESRMLVAPVANAQKITTGSTGATRPSLRNGLRLMARSPRCPGFFSHRRSSRNVLARNLIPASGDQDHTLLPSASRIPRQMMRLTSIATRPTSVTTRTPLRSRRDASRQSYFSVKRKKNIFRERA